MASTATKAKKSTGVVVRKGVSGTKTTTIQLVKAGAATTKSTSVIATVPAKKSTGTIEKIQVQQGVKINHSAAAAKTASNVADIKTQHAFSRTTLLAKQSKKTTKRKQGGVQLGTLTEKQLKTLANKQEAAPSSAE